MQINRDLLPKLKTTKTTSDIDGYSCNYIDNQITTVNNSMWKKTIGWYHQNSVNLNDFTKDGWYHFDTCQTYNNCPSGGGYPSINYFLIVINNSTKGNSSDNLVQLWISATDSPNVANLTNFWFRVKIYNTWGPWYSMKNA